MSIGSFLCRHRAVKQKKCTVFNVIRPYFLHVLVSVAAFILGETSAGPHYSILVDLLDCLALEELSAAATEFAAYSCGKRDLLSSSSSKKAYIALPLTHQLVVQLLHPFLNKRGLVQKSFSTI